MTIVCWECGKSGQLCKCGEKGLSVERIEGV